jgi:hypothetical protein
MRIFKNGALLATSSTAVTRTPDIEYLSIGDFTNAHSDVNAAYSLIHIENEQWIDSYARNVSLNPWQIFEEESLDYWIPDAAPPGGFLAAWARNRSHVIGAGAR